MAFAPSEAETTGKTAFPSQFARAVKGNHDHWNRLHEILQLLETDGGGRLIPQREQKKLQEKVQGRAIQESVQAIKDGSVRCSTPRQRPFSAPVGSRFDFAEAVPLAEGTGVRRKEVLADGCKARLPGAGALDLRGTTPPRATTATPRRLATPGSPASSPRTSATATPLLPSGGLSVKGSAAMDRPSTPEKRPWTLEMRPSTPEKHAPDSGGAGRPATPSLSWPSSRQATPLPPPPSTPGGWVVHDDRGWPAQEGATLPYAEAASTKGDSCKPTPPHTPAPKPATPSLAASVQAADDAPAEETGGEAGRKPAAPALQPLPPQQPRVASRRPMGPKATMAAAAAMRAAANWQRPKCQASLIGQNMKATHFDLSNVAMDAITRATSMESTYRRGYTWCETHASMNPVRAFKPTHIQTSPP